MWCGHKRAHIHARVRVLCLKSTHKTHAHPARGTILCVLTPTAPIHTRCSVFAPPPWHCTVLNKCACGWSLVVSGLPLLHVTHVPTRWHAASAVPAPPYLPLSVPRPSCPIVCSTPLCPTHAPGFTFTCPLCLRPLHPLSSGSPAAVRAWAPPDPPSGRMPGAHLQTTCCALWLC